MLEETGSKLHGAIFGTVHEISQLFVITWGNSVDCVLELEVNTKELASYAAKRYLVSITKTETCQSMGFQDTVDTAIIYREYLNLARMRALQERMNDDTRKLAMKVTRFIRRLNGSNNLLSLEISGMKRKGLKDESQDERDICEDCRQEEEEQRDAD